MKKWPKVYVSPIDKDLQNNKQLFYSKLSEESQNTKSVIQKINDIFHSRNFVYKKDVLVTTKNGSKVISLVGRTNDALLSLDKEKILISDIIEIKEYDPYK